MKKIFIYVSVVGLVAGIVYYLSKNKKNDSDITKPVDKRMDFEPIGQEEENVSNSDIIRETYQIKGEKIQDISERHSEASEVMKKTYSNIMEDFVEDFSDEKFLNKDNEEDIVIDMEDVLITKKIDSISDELDKLLK